MSESEESKPEDTASKLEDTASPEDTSSKSDVGSSEPEAIPTDSGPTNSGPPDAGPPADSGPSDSAPSDSGAGSVEPEALSPKPDAESADPQESASKPDGCIRLTVFGRSDVGRIREHNEDSFIVADMTKDSRGLREEDRVHIVGGQDTLIAVCDGMRKAATGEVASDLAVNIIYESLVDGDPPGDHNDLARRMVRAIEAAGLRIFNEAKLDRHHRGMGTTATVATLLDSLLFLGQVGDSRAYVLRQERLVQVTRDQSLVNQLIEAGQLTEEEAENFEHNNIILQALGTADTVQVDLTSVPLRRGDVLLICSDGLSGMIRHEEIRQTLIRNPDTVEACKALTLRANEAGGHDNVTVIVAKFEGDALREPAPDDPPLRYAKYFLPGGIGTAPTISGRRGAMKNASAQSTSSDINRSADHDSIRAKGDGALAGASAQRSEGDDEDDDLEDEGAYEGDDVVLPTPLWFLVVLVVVVFGGIALVAYWWSKHLQ